tara:strand:- start:1498 stop:1824 length:327 start_codon:yes stop_codon:yes gene_type:complete
MNRYRMAAARGRSSLEEAVQEDQDLLGEFGLGLTSLEGGLRLVFLARVRGKINPWDVNHLSLKMWGWVRPLLIELRDLRAYKAEMEREVAEAQALIAAEQVEGAVAAR